MSDASDIKQEMTELTKSINSLVIEMRERDIEDKYLRQSVVRIEATQSDALIKWTPVLERTKKWHDKVDSFLSSITNNSGRLFLIAIVILIAGGLGFDPVSIFKL